MFFIQSSQAVSSICSNVVLGYSSFPAGDDIKCFMQLGAALSVLHIIMSSFHPSAFNDSVLFRGMQISSVQPVQVFQALFRTFCPMLHEGGDAMLLALGLTNVPSGIHLFRGSVPLLHPPVPGKWVPRKLTVEIPVSYPASPGRRYRFPRQWYLRQRIERVREARRSITKGRKARAKVREQARQERKKERRDSDRQRATHRANRYEEAKQTRQFMAAATGKSSAEITEALKLREEWSEWTDFADGIPFHWLDRSVEERMEDCALIQHRYLHVSNIQFTAKYGVPLADVVEDIGDPLLQIKGLKDLLDGSSLQADSERSREEMVQAAFFAAADLNVPQIANAAADVNISQGNERYIFLQELQSDMSLPIVVDSGASLSLTPNIKDFIGEIRPCGLSHLNGLQGKTAVKGVGTVAWRVRDEFGKIATIKCQAYWVPDASIRLFSPQTYFQQNAGGHLRLDAFGVKLILPDGTNLSFPFQPRNNLPMMLSALDMNDPRAHVLNGTEADAFQVGKSQVSVFLNIASDENRNLTAAQRELMLYHQKLGHIDLQRVQSLARWSKKQGGVPTPGPIPVGLDSPMSKCPRPNCAVCQMSKQHRRSPATVTKTTNQPSSVREASKTSRKKQTKKSKTLKEGDLCPGQRVSIDQYNSAIPGRLPHTRGKEAKNKKYSGGTIFVDHASGYVYINHQVSTGARETVNSKRKFERHCGDMGVKIKAYRADNHPFRSQTFRNDVDVKGQKIDYSGVGAHHQNGVAERAIQSITTIARSLLLHQLLHWPDQANQDLWPFAMHHAAHLWNHTPQQGSRRAPVEIFSGAVINHHDHMARLHVWGAPVYVLDPKLQDGKKIPKWNPRSRLGVYLGFSPDHSTLVSNVLNPRSGHVSPQYHIVVDDLFTTVPNANCGGLYDPIKFDAERWKSLVQSGLETHEDDDDDLANDNRRSAIRRARRGALGDDWLTGPERRVRQTRRAAREARLRLRQAATSRHNNEVARHVAFRIPEGGDGGIGGNSPSSQSSHSSSQSSHDSSQSSDSSSTSENVNSDSDASMESVSLHDDELSVVEGVEDDELVDELGSEGGSDSSFSDSEVSEGDSTRDSSSNQDPNFNLPKRQSKKNPKYHGQDWANLTQAMASKKIKYEYLNEEYIAAIEWANVAADMESAFNTTSSFDRLWNATCAPYYDHETGLQDDLHPAFLATKANSEDNPNWHQAMNGPMQEGYMEAAKDELKALNHKGAWDVVKREDYMNVLPSTWAFKCKRYPDGRVRKLKARFCVRGDRQIQGVDFNETWAPVVNWNTVRMMLVLSQTEKLATTQVDYTTAFLHAPIEEEVYVEMPRGFSEPGKVLKLKRSLYGLKQSPKNFFSYLSDNLEAVGFKAQTEVDPCLFISEKCICLVYVDDTLFFAPKKEYIKEVIDKLKGQQKMELTEEDSVAGFLGVLIERDSQTQAIKLSQAGLTQRIIDAVGGGGTSPTPASTEPLGIDAEGDPPDCLYNYASVVGMLLYLSGHSRPDIAFADK